MKNRYNCYDIVYNGFVSPIGRQTVSNFRAAGGDSGALYLQSAIAGVLSHRGSFDGELPKVSGVDTWVLRNRNL